MGRGGGRPGRAPPPPPPLPRALNYVLCEFLSLWYVDGLAFSVRPCGPVSLQGYTEQRPGDVARHAPNSLPVPPRSTESTPRTRAGPGPGSMNCCTVPGCSQAETALRACGWAQPGPASIVT